MSNLNLRTNQEGIDIIKQFEGFRGRKYNCPAGYPTIGYGHRVMAGENLTTISKAEAEALLKKDLVKYEKAVRDAVRVELNANQFSALVSFCYNVGPGNLAKSSVLRLTNEEKFSRDAARLMEWNKARVGGAFQVLRGLTDRRMEERALYETPVKQVFTPVIKTSARDHPTDFSSYKEDDLTPIEVPALPPREIDPPTVTTQEKDDTDKPKLSRPQAFTPFGLVSWLLSDVFGIPLEWVVWAWSFVQPYLQSKALKWAVIAVAVIGLYGYWKGWHKSLPKKLKKNQQGTQ